MKEHGYAVDKDNYEFIFSGRLEGGKRTMDVLEALFFKFNTDHPKDYIGRSLSVSDVVVLHENGHNRSFYVDSIGFAEVEGFLEKGMEAEKKEAGKAEPEKEAYNGKQEEQEL